MKPDLTDEETDALARLLRDTIDADHYPPSPRVQMWIRHSRQDAPGAEPRTVAASETFTSRREPGDIGDGEGQLFRPYQ
jgi:hypothetical protein